MTQARIERHAELSEKYLRHAEDQYEMGDLPQASEKAWGAVAHYLKSVAKQRGWRNSSHSDLSDIATDLAYETKDPERVHILYAAMNGLHANFYEDWLSDQVVGQSIDGARELLSLLESRTRSPDASRPSQQHRR